jgi:biotin carboxyl carrier protein
VSGSIERITAKYFGRIGRVLVQPNTFVEAGAPLFAIESFALKT